MVERYADDGHSDGVETNCRIDLAFDRARGSAQLSWSQPLVSGLHIAGTDGELFMHPARPDVLRVRRSGGTWEQRACGVTWASDLRADGARALPRTYFDCIFLQLVQALRAVALGERAPAVGEDGRTIVAATAECYAKRTALLMVGMDGEQDATTSRAPEVEPCAA